GISINLESLNDNHEPESAVAALVTYGKMIMPERDLSQTISRLKPMLNEPDLATKVDQAAQKSVVTEQPEMMKNNGKPFVKSNAMLAQVVGVIIGSPEFQRK
ncbi:MAG: DUF1800 domain-containing protein, partial [Pedobacter sp.]